MENSLLSLIDSASSVLVVLPTKPYFDQVAAALSLYLSIRDRKTVEIFCPTPMMVGFNKLIGVDKISDKLGKKNLTIKFANYEASNIDKVGYDIENGEFKLTVTPKSGFAAPQKDQVIADYSGTAADLVVLVGGATEAHFPIISTSDLANSKIVHIGIRPLESQREILSFAKSSSTTSELVAELIKANGFTLDSDTATDLLMGIEEGTNNFANSEVTPDTFETFAYLLRNGGQRSPRIKLSPASFPTGSIPTKPYNVPNQTPQAPVTPITKVETPVENPSAEAGQESADTNPPSDWLQPKIFKGTSVS